MTLYGIILFLCSIHFWILNAQSLREEKFIVAQAVGKTGKEKSLHFIFYSYIAAEQMVAGLFM
jgi:hypothetical protein